MASLSETIEKGSVAALYLRGYMDGVLLKPRADTNDHYLVGHRMGRQAPIDAVNAYLDACGMSELEPREVLNILIRVPK